jgi:hypothetical protein
MVNPAVFIIYPTWLKVNIQFEMVTLWELNVAIEYGHSVR